MSARRHKQHGGGGIPPFPRNQDKDKDKKMIRTMKLYLVADYDFNGKKFATTHAIDSSNNLARLNDLTSLLTPTTGGKYVAVAPKFLLMCKSWKEALKVADKWREGYAKGGKLYDFKPIDRAMLGKAVA